MIEVVGTIKDERQRKSDASWYSLSVPINVPLFLLGLIPFLKLLYTLQQDSINGALWKATLKENENSMKMTNGNLYFWLDLADNTSKNRFF